MTTSSSSPKGDVTEEDIRAVRALDAWRKTSLPVHATQVCIARMRTQFKLSPLMRRFPELKNMSDGEALAPCAGLHCLQSHHCVTMHEHACVNTEEVAQMVAYNNQTGGHKQELPTKTRPKTEFQSTARTKVMTNSPVFYPVNPAQAKEDTKRPDSEVGTKPVHP